MTSPINHNSRQAVKGFPWPKEHGAWALVLIPYWTGVAAAGAYSLETAAVFAGLILLIFAKRPLFLGFLHNVPFFWVTTGILPHILLT